MVRPDDQRKNPALGLAALLATPTGRQIFSLLSELTPPEMARDSAFFAPSSARPRVGIWEQTDDDANVWVRTKAEPWHLWADVPELRLRADSKRVVLLGESVARGWLYDPHFNPSMQIRDLIEAQVTSKVDVIDLAQNAAELHRIKQTALSALDMRPDVLIVFAGNNFEKCLRRHDWAVAAKILRKTGSFSDARVCLHDIVKSRIQEFLAALAKAAAGRVRQIVVVIPEINLLDWCEREPIVPIMDWETNARWEHAREAAIGFMKELEFAKCEEAARQMLECDRGTSPLSTRLLAECALCSGATKEARRLFEQSRDAALFFPNKATGGSPSLQNFLRENAPQYGFTVLDLRRVFESWSHGKLPGRDLFLDNCHLTATGLTLAAQAIVAAISPALGGSELSLPARPQPVSLATPEVEANAHFRAAVVNAYANQSDELIAYHCKKAADLWPPITDVMRLFADGHVRKAPLPMCESFDKLYRYEMETCTEPGRKPMFFHDPRSMKTLHPALISGIQSVLAQSDAQSIGLTMISEHALKEKVVLLDPMYCQVPNRRVISDDWPGRRCFYREFRRQSIFRLFSDTARPVNMHLTYRTPFAPPGCGPDVYVNEIYLGQLNAAPAWRNHTIHLAGDELMIGCNEIRIVWPLPTREYAQHLEAVATGWESHELFDIYPLYGEVHNLIVEASPSICSA
jgi:hypothetical protein